MSDDQNLPHGLWWLLFIEAYLSGIEIINNVVSFRGDLLL